MEINIDIIKELIGSLGASSFDALKLETDDFKLTIERSARTQGSEQAIPAVEVNSVAVASPQSSPKQRQEPETPKGTVVKSPIVGTFYAGASPDKPAFVKVGQQVKNGDILYIVESMKLMNEIASECDGTVAEIYAQNGQTVEYGQPVMRIE
jgi:acetyl-CoA carboxylase biotin carboxyl carrier protein